MRYRYFRRDRMRYRYCRRDCSYCSEVLLQGERVAFTNSPRHVGVKGVFAPLKTIGIIGMNLFLLYV